MIPSPTPLSLTIKETAPGGNQMPKLKTHRLPLLLPLDVHEAVKALAAADRRPVSTYIVRVLEAHIESQRALK